MDDLLKFTVDFARDLGAKYADARFQDVRQTVIVCENGSLRSYESDRSVGIGIRVLAGGSWGLASSTVLDKARLRKMTEEAVRMAKATTTVARTNRGAQVRIANVTEACRVRDSAGAAHSR